MAQICGHTILFHFSHAIEKSTVSSILSLKVTGVLSFLHGLKKRRYGSQQLPIYNHWPSDFQAMLPPSCHLCCTSPLQVSKNGLSFPGSDARHFPDTLKRKSYPKPLRFKIYHLCLIEPPSPNTQAWLPPNPWHRTFAGKIKDVLFTEFLPPILLGLFHWQHQDNCHRSWSEKDESDDKKSMSIIILACCLFVMAKTWFPPKPWQYVIPTLKFGVWLPMFSSCVVHLLSCLSTHRVKAAITVRTPHFTQMQIVQRHLQFHSSQQQKRLFLRLSW